MTTRAPEDVIVVDALRKVYDEKEAVAGITFSVRRGEVFGLLGPNGSGKTTALETIVGLRRPTSGTVTVLGVDPARDRRRITERVAVQPQAAALFPTLTVRETIQLFASFYGARQDPEAIIEEVGLQDEARARVKNLSGGQERRLLIGIALVGKPEILVLDEPSAGLDPASRRNLWSIIERQRERGTSVLLSTHHMDEATQVCDRLAILVHGSIAVEGEPDALIRQYSATATVSFTLPPTTTGIDINALGLTGDITTTETYGGTRVAVVTDDADAVLRRLTFTPGLHAFDYAVKHGSLEDVFLDAADRKPTESTNVMP
ncbi:ABC transporter ATP-binding protein [Microbacterium lushaniae]|uniref:ABC transporter ATP-binding protein n=1 Tax=Microbacterium lushaniae TaxID=2614639 RepID=A0A5J6L3R0_9MICO|nr:ABC transporter ATP-binding protein [Microbacterium lushaniae]QEW03021.1 ABC transporter ATP-binding protein [Microbacterium lushaniae]